MPLYQKTLDGLVAVKAHQKNSDGTLRYVTMTPSGGGGSGGETSTYNPAAVWDYQTNNLSQWENAHGNAPVIVSSPHPQWPLAARFTLNDATRASFDAQNVRRTEMTSTVEKTGAPTRGLRQFWGWTTWFPTNFVAPTNNPDNGGWFYWMQWHHAGSTGNVPLAFTVTTNSNPPRLLLDTAGSNYDIGTIPTDRADSLGNRVDVVVDVTWHDDPNLGRVKVKFNGVQKVDVACPNLLTDGLTTQGMYVKQGAYGNRYSSGTTPEPQAIIHHTGLRRGSTEASITKN